MFVVFRDFSSAISKTNGDLWALPMMGTDLKPIVVANSAFNETWGQFSPDGGFVALATNESGGNEIIVQAFPNPSAKWPVSTGGGQWPRWKSDGTELYFMSLDKKLMAARMRITGSSFEAERPVALFQTRAVSPFGSFDVSSDGKFLVNQTLDEPVLSPSPITLILNWKP